VFINGVIWCYAQGQHSRKKQYPHTLHNIKIHNHRMPSIHVQHLISDREREERECLT